MQHTNAGSANSLVVDAPTGRRVALAGGIGNYLEWFDFGLYGFMAVTIGPLFFPSSNPTVSLLGALAVFGVAFLFRPLGGIVIGAYGDRKGRKAALSLSILLMGACTTLFGLLPTFSQVGIIAPIILVILRCGQGFSAGGEYAGALAFLIEYAPRNRRGLYSSVISATAGLGVVSGGMLTLALTSSMSTEALNSWGWRLPFLFAGPLAAIGLYVRLKMEDTPVFRTLESHHEVSHSPLKGVSKYSKKGIALVFTCTAVAGLGFYYLATYVITYLTVNVGLPRSQALLLASVGLLIYAALCPLAGKIGDRYGRRPTMLAGAGGLAVLSIPIFLAIATGNPALVIVVLTLFAACEALANVMLGVLMVELFPAHLRMSGAGIGFNTAQAVIGGQGPLVATLLAAALPTLVFAPALYIVGVTAIAVVVLWALLPETHDRSLASTNASLPPAHSHESAPSGSSASSTSPIGGDTSS